MTSIKEMPYENNISGDIVSIRDTLESELIKVSRKLEDKNKPFFLVVLDDNNKIKGVITRDELREMLNEAKKGSDFKIEFEDYAKKHVVFEENEDAIKGLKELKKVENKGFVLIKNKEGNYVGKILLADLI